MEIKRHFPEITVVGLAELGAAALATKQAIEGNPLATKDLAVYFAIATFYLGLPAAVVVRAAREAYDWYTSSSGNK